jgi:hypothetical protein
MYPAPNSAFVGSKYDKKLIPSDIAKLVRVDVKKAKADGLLPKKLKLSIRSSRNSVRVQVKESPLPLYRARNFEDIGPPHMVEVLSDVGKDVQKVLQDILLAYKRDNSNAMYDYFESNFYDFISLR